MIKQAPDSNEAGLVRARVVARGVRGPVLTAAMLVVGVHLALGIAHADVVTAEDVAACNQEARESSRGRAASPTRKDEAAADTARKAPARTPERPDARGNVTRSADPQIDGMDGEGAKDAAYRAAYRVCMRKKGF
jgi:hypothetical protein